MTAYPSVSVTCYLLLGQLDLVELLHVLLVVLLLELSDETQLLLWAVGVLLSSILLELHCCLSIQRCHYLLSETWNTGEGLVRKETQETDKGRWWPVEGLRLHPRFCGESAFVNWIISVKTSVKEPFQRIGCLVAKKTAEKEQQRPQVTLETSLLAPTMRWNC